MNWIFAQMLKVTPEDISSISKEDDPQTGITTYTVTCAGTTHQVTMTELLDFVQHDLQDQALAQRLLSQL